MRSCIVVEQNNSKGELVQSFWFSRLVKRGTGLRVNLVSCKSPDCCPVLQEVCQKGTVLVEEEIRHNLSCTCMDDLGISRCWWVLIIPFETCSKYWHRESSPVTIRARNLFTSLAVALHMIKTVGYSTCFLSWLKTVSDPFGHTSRHFTYSVNMVWTIRTRP